MIQDNITEYYIDFIVREFKKLNIDGQIHILTQFNLVRDIDYLTDENIVNLNTAKFNIKYNYYQKYYNKTF